jgi:hypothetical protein
LELRNLGPTSGDARMFGASTVPPAGTTHGE